MRTAAPRLATGSLVAAASILTALAFLPWGVWLGEAREGESAALAATMLDWLLWTAAIAAMAVLARAVLGEHLDEILDRWLAVVRGIPRRVFVAFLSLVTVGAAALFSAYLFQRNPHLVDTIAQLFQARIFLEGSLTAPAPEHAEFFLGQHLARHAGRWFSQYPPGHPALLALGLLVGAPWLVNPLFAGASIALVYAIGRRLLGEGSGRLAAVLYLIAPFALFMSGSYMNHITTGFFLLLALYAALRTVDGEGGRIGWAVVTGLALGIAGLIRPLEAAAWAGALGLWLLFRGGWRVAVVAGAACAVAIAPLLAYNAATTGHPLRFGYTLLWGEGHGLGFHTDPWGEPFTPLKSFAITALDFQRLNIRLFEWPFPSLLFAIAALVAAAWDPRARRPAGLLTLLLFAAPAAYFFYWHRDDYLGPRFLFPSLGPVVLLTALGIAFVDRHAGQWRSAFRVFVLTCALAGLTLNVPETAGVIAGRLPGMKLHPDRELRQAGVDSALVFVKVGWGNRLISRFWSWGLSAAETEQTYRVVDGCRLEQALGAADSLAATGTDTATVLAMLRERLHEWRQQNLPVVHELWPEPSVRFDTTRALPPSCAGEVEEDTHGFTLYGTLIWHNDPWLRDGIIYARDLGWERNRLLMRQYPDRPYFRYAPPSGEAGVRPELMPLQPLTDRVDRQPHSERPPASNDSGGGP